MSYESEVLLDSPSIFLRFKESSVTTDLKITDTSGNSNAPFFRQNTGSTLLEQIGPLNKEIATSLAFNFIPDSTNFSYLEWTPVLYISDTPFFQFYFQPRNSSNLSSLITFNNGMSLNYNPTTLRLFWTNDDASTIDIIDSELALGKWNSIRCYCNLTSSEITIEVNDKRILPITISITGTTTNSDFSLKYLGFGDNKLEGSIAEFSAHSTELTDARKLVHLLEGNDLFLHGRLTKNENSTISPVVGELSVYSHVSKDRIVNLTSNSDGYFISKFTTLDTCFVVLFDNVGTKRFNAELISYIYPTFLNNLGTINEIDTPLAIFKLNNNTQKFIPITFEQSDVERYATVEFVLNSGSSISMDFNSLGTLDTKLTSVSN